MKKKTNQTPTRDNEVLPISMAKPMAFLSLLLSLGVIAILYFFFLRSIFTGVSGLWVVLVMVVMLSVSHYIAMKSIMKKLRCEQCHQPFFAKVSELFVAPKQCQSCGKAP